LNTTPNTIPPKTIGFIVNPVAGMGGAVGLKGTDGKSILQKAIALGAKPIASKRAEIFLSELSLAKPYLTLIVGAGAMGEWQAKKLNYTYRAVGENKKETSSEDTQTVAKAILEMGVDLLVFCGGDGSTRDIQRVINLKIPVLGVPTGVKMHSALFAVNPQAAARVAMRFLWGGLPIREAEVMDVDENEFREGRLSAELYGYMLSPFEPHLIQGNKMASPMTENELENQAAIAVYIIEEMKPNVLYIMAPGTTTRTVADLLDQKKTLLGVDLLENNKIIASDVNEQQILQALKGKTAHIIVTPIGGQGIIFGRGNQQISNRVIRQVGIENITIIATKSKLDHLSSLRVDTNEAELDAEFRARRVQVVTDYKTKKEMAVE
jgi:predicted polyphosphate/ATP-dependent NAD kinase